MYTKHGRYAIWRGTVMKTFERFMFTCSAALFTAALIGGCAGPGAGTGPREASDTGQGVSGRLTPQGKPLMGA